MMKKILLAIALTSIALTACSGEDSKSYTAEKGNTTNPYMGAEVTLGEADNGAIVNQEVLDNAPKVTYLGPEIEQPAEGIYVIGGHALVPISVIDTPEGLIVYDVGDSKHDGENLLKAIRSFSDKPVKAIIYGHSHTVLGAAILAEGNDDF